MAKSSKKAKQRELYPEWMIQIILIVDSAFEAIIVFFVFLQLTGLAFGSNAPNGTEISGWTSVLPPLLTVAYFIVMYRYLGGTISARLARWLHRARY